MNNSRYTIKLMLCTLFIALVCLFTVNATEEVPAKYTFTLSFSLESDVTNKDAFTDIVVENIDEKEYTFTWAYGEPKKNGYSFSGWSTSPTSGTATIFVDSESGSCSFTSECSEGTTSSTTLYPVWKLIEYSIEYDTNEGIIFGAVNKYTVSDSIKLTKPTRNGYTFNGWDVTFYGDCGWYEGSISPDTAELYSGQWGNVLLTAKWVLNEYKICFDTAGGETLDDINYTVHKGIYLPEISRHGYKFTHWSVASSEENNWEKTIPNGTDFISSGLFGNVTLYANWETVEYTIEFDTDGAGNLEPISYNILSDDFTIPSVTNYGYKFIKWIVESSDDKSNNWGESISKNQEITTGYFGNVSLTAVWEEEEVTFKFVTKGNGGTTSPSSMTVGVVTGVPSSVATPNNGYRFAGWYYDDEFIMPVEDNIFSLDSGVIVPKRDTDTELFYAETFYAKFELITGDLTIFAENVENENGFIFDISGIPYASELSEINLTVAILPGEMSVTVCELPSGDYTVTEEDGWSWRFETTEIEEFSLSYSSYDISLNFTFNSMNEKWLTRSIHYKKED